MGGTTAFGGGLSPPRGASGALWQVMTDCGWFRNPEPVLGKYCLVMTDIL